jgi:hypothetical protein
MVCPPFATFVETDENESLVDCKLSPLKAFGQATAHAAASSSENVTQGGRDASPCQGNFRS